MSIAGDLVLCQPSSFVTPARVVADVASLDSSSNWHDPDPRMEAPEFRDVSYLTVNGRIIELGLMLNNSNQLNFMAVGRKYGTPLSVPVCWRLPEKYPFPWCYRGSCVEAMEFVSRSQPLRYPLRDLF